eukprot:4922879-Amphidinium_carterae.1
MKEDVKENLWKIKKPIRKGNPSTKHQANKLRVAPIALKGVQQHVENSARCICAHQTDVVGGRMRYQQTRDSCSNSEKPGCGYQIDGGMVQEMLQGLITMNTQGNFTGAPSICPDGVYCMPGTVSPEVSVAANPNKVRIKSYVQRRSCRNERPEFRRGTLHFVGFCAEDLRYQVKCVPSLSHLSVVGWDLRVDDLSTTSARNCVEGTFCGANSTSAGGTSNCPVRWYPLMLGVRPHKRNTPKEHCRSRGSAAEHA